MPTISKEETKGREYKLPDYETVFKIKRNPLIDDPHLSIWIQEVFESSQIPADKFTKIEPTVQFVAYMFPLCEDINKFENLIKIFLLFFVLDDHTECEWGYVARDVTKCDEIWGQVIDGMDKLLGSETYISMTGWKPYTRLLYNTFEDVFQELNLIQRKRMSQLMKDYAFGSKTETNQIDYIKYETLDQIIKIKRDSMTVFCVFDFIEYVNDIPLTDEEWNDPPFQEMLLLAVDSGILANDIGSFEKEYREQNEKIDRFYNTISMTVILDKCSIEEAMHKIGVMLEEYENKTIESMKRLLSSKNITSNQKRFIESLDYLMGANFHCALTLTRYTQF